MDNQNNLLKNFINKARKKHGNKYDYSNVVYINRETKVRIICPIHGEFLQAPSTHLNTCGCKACGYELRKKQSHIPSDLFVLSLKNIYGNKYDYSETHYTGVRNKISFICPIHGKVTMLAGNHIKGHGCPKCGIETRAKKESLTTLEFIEKAKSVHGDKYDYSKVEYKNSYSKVCIICHKHGEFWQSPNNHLNGSCCPKCSYLNSKSTISNVGINDFNYISKSKCYRRWKAILERVNDINNKVYKNVSICEEWLLFSNFKRWYDENYVEGFQIDKDLLSSPNNKIYSPQTCCFLPRIINNAIKSLNINSNAGVKQQKNGKFCVVLSHFNKQSLVGYFSSIQEAKIAYNAAKKQYIKELAEKYFKEGSIPEKVYKALIDIDIK